MRSSLAASPPEGASLITKWLRDLHAGDDIRSVWTPLDHDLRLAIAQAFLLHTGGREGDEERAMRLASAEPTDPDFSAMASTQARHWRSTLAPFTHGATFAWQPRPVGADMELWAALPTAALAAGELPRPQPFLTRRASSGPLIAAVGHQLPVPGWPPSTWVVPHLRGSLT